MPRVQFALDAGHFYFDTHPPPSPSMGKGSKEDHGRIQFH